jgi:uncharacterized protein YdeI (YjbR/CyaY-like superfamily)
VNELWLIFYKKETGKPSIDYEAAVEEALCFGWIDSLVKKIDGEKYARKFTPRKNSSVWSDLNKMRVKKLIKNGKMTEFGLDKINAAKEIGAWNKKTKSPKISYDAPKDFISELNKNKKARSNFDEFPISDKKRFYMWINIAKKKETRERRIKESIDLLNKNKVLGLK